MPPLRCYRPLWLYRNYSALLKIFSETPSTFGSRVFHVPAFTCELFADDGYSVPAIMKPGHVARLLGYVIKEFQPLVLSDTSTEETLLLTSKVTTLTSQVDSIRTDVSTLFDMQYVASARLMEEQCGRTNESKMSRLVIHGLPRVNGPNRDAVRGRASEAALNRLKELFPGKEITFVYVDYFDGPKPVYELTLGSQEVAEQIRKEFGRRSIDDRRATGITILNWVTPATRVRISIMKVNKILYLLVMCLFL